MARGASEAKNIRDFCVFRFDLRANRGIVDAEPGFRRREYAENTAFRKTNRRSEVQVRRAGASGPG